MGVYLRAKFEVSRKILTSFRLGSSFTPTHPPTSKRTPKTPTQITVKTLEIDNWIILLFLHEEYLHLSTHCRIALHQCRFSFRHYKVLCEIVITLKNFSSLYKPNKSSDINFINFVREGKKPKTAPCKGFLDLLHSDSEWNLKFDLDGMLVVALLLAVSTLPPYMSLFLMPTKKVIIIELTCPCEENMSQWHVEKSQKYYLRCCSIISNGWSVYFYAIEVSVRVFVLSQLEVTFVV